MRPIGRSDSEKPSASASAASHSTWRLHGCAAAQAGGAPVRETETTLQPAPASVWQTRLPTKPLPPKTAIRGGVEAAVAAQSAAIMVMPAMRALRPSAQSRRHRAARVDPWLCPPTQAGWRTEREVAHQQGSTARGGGALCEPFDGIRHASSLLGRNPPPSPRPVRAHLACRRRLLPLPGNLSACLPPWW